MKFTHTLSVTKVLTNSQFRHGSASLGANDHVSCVCKAGAHCTIKLFVLRLSLPEARPQGRVFPILFVIRVRRKPK